jgi:hypothetical protein
MAGAWQLMDFKISDLVKTCPELPDSTNSSASRWLSDSGFDLHPGSWSIPSSS